MLAARPQRLDADKENSTASSGKAGHGLLPGSVGHGKALPGKKPFGAVATPGQQGMLADKSNTARKLLPGTGAAKKPAADKDAPAATATAPLVAGLPNARVRALRDITNKTPGSASTGRMGNHLAGKDPQSAVKRLVPAPASVKTAAKPPPPATTAKASTSLRIWADQAAPASAGGSAKRRAAQTPRAPAVAARQAQSAAVTPVMQHSFEPGSGSGSGTGSEPASESVTPLASVQKHHDQVDVDTQPAVQLAEETPEADDESDWEIEYMPPSTYNLPYRFPDDLDIDVGQLMKPPVFEFVRPSTLKTLEQSKRLFLDDPLPTFQPQHLPPLDDALESDFDTPLFAFDSSALII
ncbi:hypothetical protein BC831DRAFT_442127 [Entophlyctis helioformis]|nr:hypothetical protein BC831DRAFT_442127 [Entophlyctis helioformis]